MYLENEENFVYPSEGESLSGMLDIIKRIQKVLSSSNGLRCFASDDRLLLATGLHRFCYHFGANPSYLLAMLEMEQSLLTTMPARSPWAYQAACGVVGQDQAGTNKPQMAGLIAQLFITAKNAAWSAGRVQDWVFGRTPAHRPRWKRWGENGNAPMGLVHLLDKPQQEYICKTMGEYVNLIHCPHLGRLETYEKVMRNRVIPFYGVD